MAALESLKAYTRRVPLRIPSGWVVHHNIFYLDQPILENGLLINGMDCKPSDNIGNNFNDSEDLLWIALLIPEDKKGVWNEIAIDLGWYTNRFRGELLFTPAERLKDMGVYPQCIAAVESTCVEEIRQTIEAWLEHWPKFLGIGVTAIVEIP